MKDQANMNRGLIILQLQDELRNSPEYEIVRELQGHDLSVFIFDRNYQRLLHMRRALSENPDAKTLMYARNHDLLMEFLSEIIRMIHNFVASAMSLIDHTRRIYNTHYRDSNLIPEYEKVKNETFVKDPLSCFVRDLRKYCQHYKAPNIEFETYFETMQHEPKYTFFLLRDDLLAFRDWSSLAKNFLKEKEKVDVLEVAGLYRERVLKFHHWFSIKRREIHADKIKSFRERENEVLFLILEDKIEFTEALSKQEFPHKKDEIFLSFFSSSDFDKLEKIPRDSLDRPLQAIKWIEERHFQLPEKMKKRIIDLYKLPDIIPE